MSSAGEWTEEDFESLSWHDNHVHGLRIEGGGEQGTGALSLDLDYIVEWLATPGGSYRFRIAPATLRFHDVFGLKVEIDWNGGAMCPFSISGISRHRLEHDSWAWSIAVNWPRGFITFESIGFTQVLRAPAITKSTQCLEPHERGTCA
jgi:hypothetical protein